LAATTAEVLRNSPFAADLGLADVLAAGRGLRGPLALQDTYRDFMSLVQRADELDQRRRGRREGRNK
jgi:hypothetical protein